jgi:DNA-binding LacI/PurR family transcriptional regulator
MRGPQSAPDFDAHNDIMSWGIVRGIIIEARRFNYDVKLEALVDVGLTEDVINHIKPELTDGVIFESASEMEEVIEYIKSLEIPYVVLNSSGFKKESLKMKTVSFKMETGIRAAIDHLCSSGRKKIAYAGCERSVFSNNNFKIVMEALKEKNLFDEKLVFDVRNFMDIKKLVSRWGDKLEFDALIGLNDTVGDLFYKELTFAGFKIPEDCAIIGIGGVPIYQAPGSSCLSSVKLPFYELASAGGNALVSMIDKGQLTLPENRYLKTEFIKAKTS